MQETHRPRLVPQQVDRDEAWGNNQHINSTITDHLIGNLTPVTRPRGTASFCTSTTTPHSYSARRAEHA